MDAVSPVLASIPSPARGVWSLGPLPIRAYALCIILGVIIGVWIGERRWVARGGIAGTVTDAAAWAVPFGLVGGRLYSVFTTPAPYFGPNGHLIDIVKVWHGGLGIWGAIALGGVGVWICLHRRGIKVPPFADAVAPGIAVAQAIGRWGNWFNQELYGKATHLPWALHITRTDNGRIPGYYHPTFLYESLWDLGVAGVVILVDRKLRLGRGKAFALYVALYVAGRSWIEYLRIDNAEHFFGIRLNDWTCMVVFLGAVLWMVTHRGPREEVVQPVEADGGPGTPQPADGASAGGTAASSEPGAALDDGAGDGGGHAVPAQGAQGARSPGDHVPSLGDRET